MPDDTPATPVDTPATKVDTPATKVDTPATKVDTPATKVDAVLLVGFGGPEGPDDVLPFMKNVTDGRGIPDERLVEVSQHYYDRGGISPIQEQCRELRAALEADLHGAGHDLRVYWGNRNWDPYLADTIAQMRDDGVRHAVAVLTSAYSSYSGCRQYREDVERARAVVGDDAPTFEKVRAYYNHPGFIGPQAGYIHDALATLSDDVRADARIVFTTHSIPHTMSRHSDYEAQTREACRIAMEQLTGHTRGTHSWDLVYNSRSGPAFVPWLTPDINDHITALAAGDTPAVVVVPIGFISDHMEVIYDLDTEAAATAEAAGIEFARAATVGIDPAFVTGLRQLVEEHLADTPPLTLGTRGPNWTECPVDCCLTPGTDPAPTIASAPDRVRPRPHTR
jgi:ferrochelatase